MAVKIEGLLIGQSVDQEVRDEIVRFLEDREEIESVLNLITLQLGAQIMVAVKAKMKPVETTDQLIQNINRCEAALKKHSSQIKWSFFEPDVE
jgi:divalent metal cation (Fe/Co/Zn/Cd) transporter